MSHLQYQRLNLQYYMPVLSPQHVVVTIMHCTKGVFVVLIRDMYTYFLIFHIPYIYCSCVLLLLSRTYSKEKLEVKLLLIAWLCSQIMCQAILVSRHVPGVCFEETHTTRHPIKPCDQLTTLNSERCTKRWEVHFSETDPDIFHLIHHVSE